MPLPKALIAENFDRGIALMTKALDTPKGLRIGQPNPEAAHRYRLLLNTIRREHRELMGGKSPFDCLVFSLEKPDQTAILMKKAEAFFDHDVEEL